MKRYIYAASKQSVIQHAIDGFCKDPDCLSATAQDIHDDHCTLVLHLKSQSKPITVTVWYDSSNIDNGVKHSLVSWDASYVVLPSGHVHDAFGNYVGVAKVDTIISGSHRTKKSYHINSIRTDSRDVLIDHPEDAGNYSQVLLDLKNRTITQRT